MSEANTPTPAVLPKSDQNLVWLDCEMTGLNPENDRIIEIAVVVTGPRWSLASKARCWSSTSPMSNWQSMDAWNKGTHGRSGLIDKVKASTLTEEQAEAEILAFLRQYVPKGVAPCAATALVRIGASGALHAQAGGVLSLPQCRCEHPQGAGQALEARGLFELQKGAAHTALADVHESIDELAHYRTHFLAV
jgi:oligoribonuclease